MNYVGRYHSKMKIIIKILLIKDYINMLLLKNYISFSSFIK